MTRLRVRHYLTSQPPRCVTGAHHSRETHKRDCQRAPLAPGWYVVDTSRRPERVLTRALSIAEAQNPRTLQLVSDRAGRIEW